MIIKTVSARSIKDSRGERTIEVSVNGSAASAPSGKSTGKYETPQYYKTLTWNVQFLKKWKEELEINNFEDLIKVEKSIQKILKLKSAKDFGANALYAFESAILKALAKEQGVELWQLLNPRALRLPVPVGNVIGGGLHSAQFKKHPVFQEFLIIPQETSLRFNTQVMNTLYVELGRLLKAKKKNDEGAWHAAIDDEAVLKTISQFAKIIHLGVDVAASSFYKDGLYTYNDKKRTRESHLDHVVDSMKRYGVFYIEDPLEENDFEGFARFRKDYSEALVVGDDLTATQLDRLKKAIESRSISGMIIKPNQNGSLLEVKEIVHLCKEHGIATIMSHRSGETMDDALADYAFGFQTDYIKCGIATEWREAKLNRLVDIESSFIENPFEDTGDMELDHHRAL